MPHGNDNPARPPQLNGVQGAASSPTSADGPAATKEEEGFITRKGIVSFGGLGGAAVASVAAWEPAGPSLAILIGFFAGLAAMASLHELLPKRWR
ncbi:hypothetical protein [Actinoplanes sp. GCM10030250]|uniref:hypothetical protein n=1 Tax=Actinoplanes sp. GCM10030250 TaxID=3273376 RepID=UPI00361DC6A8